MENNCTVLALVRDLMFASKIAAEARAAGVEVRIVRDSKLLADQPGSRLMVDLNQEGSIPAAVAWKQATGGQVVGFASHIDTRTLAAARQAGIDHVMPRSQFVAQLPNLLRSA